jgi:hypothetical protein
MEADWEVEIGGGAPVIEAEGPGWIDLRTQPERVSEIAEAAGFAALGKLLTALNGAGSPWWTSKCDLWQEETGELACYVDLLPVEGRVFEEWQQAENSCRAFVARLADVSEPRASENDFETAVALVVRAAVAGKAEGFGITVYLSAGNTGQADATGALSAAMDVFADALPSVRSPAQGTQKTAVELQ